MSELVFAGRVLGIDPGLTRCGYAVIDARSVTDATAVALGVIRTSAGEALPRRLATLRAELAALITEFRPATVVVEHVFFQVNVRTAMSVGQASGLALAEAAAAGCEVAQYTPNQVKGAVAGWGAASKEQVQRMVQTRLRLSSTPQPPDAADAAALALCHLATVPLQRRVAEAVREAAVIGSLRGEVLERNVDGTVLLEVGGVGYVVAVTPRTLAELEPTTSVFLHVHHHVRESEQTLFGFATREERATFQTLIATHGVGPALAMAILATHPPPALVDVVAAADVGALTMVPGVGRKTAERLLVELKSRLSVPVLDPVGGAGGGGSVIGDVRDALAGLGYGPEEIRESLRELPTDVDAATLLRDALKVLGARRAG